MAIVWRSRSRHGKKATNDWAASCCWAPYRPRGVGSARPRSACLRKPLPQKRTPARARCGSTAEAEAEPARCSSVVLDWAESTLPQDSQPLSVARPLTVRTSGVALTRASGYLQQTSYLTTANHPMAFWSTYYEQPLMLNTLASRVTDPLLLEASVDVGVWFPSARDWQGWIMDIYHIWMHRTGCHDWYRTSWLTPRFSLYAKTVCLCMSRRGRKKTRFQYKERSLDSRAAANKPRVISNDVCHKNGLVVSLSGCYIVFGSKAS
jgi:hypothetical protein